MGNRAPTGDAPDPGEGARDSRAAGGGEGGGHPPRAPPAPPAPPALRAATSTDRPPDGDFPGAPATVGVGMSDWWSMGKVAYVLGSGAMGRVEHGGGKRARLGDTTAESLSAPRLRRYSQAVDAIIRPPRHVYALDELGACWNHSWSARRVEPRGAGRSSPVVFDLLAQAPPSSRCADARSSGWTSSSAIRVGCACGAATGAPSRRSDRRRSCLASSTSTATRPPASRYGTHPMSILSHSSEKRAAFQALSSSSFVFCSLLSPFLFVPLPPLRPSSSASSFP